MPEPGMGADNDHARSVSMDQARSQMERDSSSDQSDGAHQAATNSCCIASSERTEAERLASERTTTEQLVADVSAAQRAAGIGSMDAAQAAAQNRQISQPGTDPVSEAIPNGLSGTAQGLQNTGYRTLVDNPQLTVRYEATEPAWRGTGGFSVDAAAQLEARGIEVAPGTHPVPAGSVAYSPNISPQSVTSHNGLLAEQAIAQRYSQIPGARIDQQFRYDANLRPANDPRMDLPGDRKVDVRVEIDHATDPRLNEVIEIESKATTRITPSRLNEAQVDHDAARLSRNASLRSAGETLETVGRYARPVGVVLDAVDVVGAYRADGNTIGMNTGEAVSGIAGGSAGGWAGASMGAAIGTAIMPGVGTVVGGLVGAAAGAFVGDRAGRGIFGTVAGWFS